jgi:FdhE protein
VVSLAVDELKRKRPEWTPWLALVDEVLRESTKEAWTSVVPPRPASHPPMPALSGAAVAVPAKLLRDLVDRFAAAARGGTPKMLAAANLLRGDVDPARIFHASLTQDADDVAELSSSANIDPEALQAVVTLLGVPFLQACRAAWATSNGTPWTEGHCRTCGAWPAFAEVRGVERSRFYRCGRCGSEWHAEILRCAYCRSTNHDEMVSLLPEKEKARGAIDACRRCSGYVKVFTRLQGCPPLAVMLEDLASVDLDVAALDAGYRRPSRAGCTPALSVQIAGGRRFLAWNA